MINKDNNRDNLFTQLIESVNYLKNGKKSESENFT